MAKKSSIKITGVKASTIATFEGTLGAILGLGVAIINSLDRTVNLAEQTNSVLAGLYFGYIHGWIFNVVIGQSGGIEFDTAD